MTAAVTPPTAPSSTAPSSTAWSKPPTGSGRGPSGNCGEVPEGLDRESVRARGRRARVHRRAGLRRWRSVRLARRCACSEREHGGQRERTSVAGPHHCRSLLDRTAWHPGSTPRGSARLMVHLTDQSKVPLGEPAAVPAPVQEGHDQIRRREPAQRSGLTRSVGVRDHPNAAGVIGDLRSVGGPDRECIVRSHPMSQPFESKILIGFEPSGETVQVSESKDRTGLSRLNDGEHVEDPVPVR